MVAPKRFFLWTSVLLAVDADTYDRGKDLSDAEITALILQACQEGVLKRFGTRPVLTKVEANTGPEGL